MQRRGSERAGEVYVILVQEWVRFLSNQVDSALVDHGIAGRPPGGEQLAVDGRGAHVCAQRPLRQRDALIEL